jgi:hypothetical protein
MLVIGGVSAFFILDISKDINLLINGNVEYPNDPDQRYFYLFFIVNVVFTLLFLSAVGLVSYKNFKYKPILFTLYFLFALHMFSSPGLQLSRTIMYFMPMFYLIAVTALSHLDIHYFAKMSIIVLMGTNVWIHYPAGFWQKPYVPTEINYMDYKKAFDFAAYQCKGKDIYMLMHFPFIPLFYNLEPDYTSYISFNLLSKDTKYYEKDGQYYSTYGSIKVITDQDFIKLLSAADTCIIINPEYQHSARYALLDDYKNLTTKYKYYQKFEGVIVLFDE